MGDSGDDRNGRSVELQLVFSFCIKKMHFCFLPLPKCLDCKIKKKNALPELK